MKQMTADDLTEAMMLLDSAKLLSQEMCEDYFYKLDPEKNTLAICHDFRWIRAKIVAIDTLLWDMDRSLKNLGASTGYPGTQTDKGRDAS